MSIDVEMCRTGGVLPKQALDRLEVLFGRADSATCASLLRLSVSAQDLAAGKRIHDHITKCGNDKSTYLGALLLHMYVKCGALQDAQEWFDKMQGRNVIAWNLMIGLCVRQGQHQEAHELLEEMNQKGVIADKVTFIYMLSVCTSLNKGKQVYREIRLRGLESDIIVGTALVTMFGKCGSMAEARTMFDKMVTRNVVSWNAILAAYAQNGQGKEALQLFNQMQQEGMLPDKITFVNILSACASSASLHDCKRMHAYITCCEFEFDNIVKTALVNMYGKRASLNDARATFNEMQKRKVVSWNVMITIYAQHGHNDEAFQVFTQMQQEGVMSDNVTFVGLLDACARQAALNQGKRLHLQLVHCGFEFDVIVATALVNVYGKCGKVHVARMMFDKMPDRNVISWNTMISAYAQFCHGNEALQLFNQMQGEGMIPNKVTFVGVFSSCAIQAALGKGKAMHSIIIRSEVASVIGVANALISMYGKCGSLDDAQRVFDEMSHRDGSSWNAMIAVYAQHGDCKNAVQLFEKMQQECVVADDITFVSILSACSHAGLVDEGSNCLISMNQDHGMTPSVEHYDCMIDMLCRAGLLNEAESLINKMPYIPTVMSWTALLGACRSQIDVERGKRATNYLLILEPEATAPNIVLSSIYAAAGRTDDKGNVMKVIARSS